MAGIAGDGVTMPDRYEKQKCMPEIGPAGQERLAESSVVIIGCGALGSVQCDLLARAGLGHLRLVDPDHVDITNLHRQILFDEEDARKGRLKVSCAARKLRLASSDVMVEKIPDLATPDNLPTIIHGADIVLDATDSIQSRIDIDRACRDASLPWIYGGIMGARGTVIPMPVGMRPLEEILGGMPPPSSPGAQQGWKKSGLFSPAVLSVASLQVSLAIRYLVTGSLKPKIYALDLWNPSLFGFLLSSEDESES